MKETGEIIQAIEDWGAEKGLHDDPGAQLEKFFEETGELARAHGEMQSTYDSMAWNVELHELKDAIGDCAVVLINIAAAYDLTFEECLMFAWLQIRDRAGRVEEGIFIKDEDHLIKDEDHE